MRISPHAHEFKNFQLKSDSFEKWMAPEFNTFPEETAWLESRRKLEGAQGLWRVDNSIYDLTDFAKNHPGGEQWINLSKGTDITELFKTYHVTDAPRQLLSAFYVQSAKTPRNSPFTFGSNDFYETLRRRVNEKLRHVQRGPSLKAKMFADSLLVLFLACCWSTARFESHVLAVVAGLFLCVVTICAHNFFHQRDNWRMHYFRLCGFSVTGWRVSHAMSHHMYPNSIHDMEMRMLEPWLQWCPSDKTLFHRFASWLYSPVVYTLLLPMAILLRWGISGHDGAIEAVSLVVPLVLWMGQPAGISGILPTLYWWVAVIFITSFFFGLIGVNAGHHHPELFHDGDRIIQKSGKVDWGIYQMLAVRDRRQANDNIVSLALFGDHALHHLFPSLDHMVLPMLYPELEKTCREFGIELKTCTIWEATMGQFLQLARVRKLMLTHGA
ncbi:unnamed protein product [Nesidiocoris tenuis]|uniref:Cytochrome b5 heme-binding domain-containing protein n=1 Tax=Nesidiocoris tenuis TaxID=355587 RepID=A0A6H5HTC1_9HEMI|nr:unnamed protein product [Nesidiocoris tenuis]